MKVLFFTILLLAGLVGSIAYVDAASVCHIRTKNFAPPAGYGAAYDVFSTNTLFVKVNCDASGADLIVGSGNQAEYIFENAYEFRSGAWQPMLLDGTKEGQWLRGNATKRLPRSAAELRSPNHVVAHVCKWRTNRWYCGCADRTCAQGLWQLQTFFFDPVSVSASLGQSFTLPVGSTATVGPLSITLEEVTEDSRCPIDVTCVWAGRIAARIAVKEGSAKQTLTVTNYDPAITSGNRYSISLIDATPAPLSTRTITPTEYRLTFVVNANAFVELPIEAEFPDKIVYTRETNYPQKMVLHNHCASQGGVFVECGTPCATGETCPAVCALACILEGDALIEGKIERFDFTPWTYDGPARGVVTRPYGGATNVLIPSGMSTCHSSTINVNQNSFTKGRTIVAKGAVVATSTISVCTAQHSISLQ